VARSGFPARGLQALRQETSSRNRKEEDKLTTMKMDCMRRGSLGFEALRP
jgi:hypothetical protein